MATYYLNNDLGNDSNGTGPGIDAYKTMPVALKALSSGDTLEIQNGTGLYTDWPRGINSGNGYADNVTVKNYGTDTPKFTFLGMTYNSLDGWTFEGLTFDHCERIEIGATAPEICNDFRWSNCTFQNSPTGLGAQINIQNAGFLEFFDCTFINLRSRELGNDTNAILNGWKGGMHVRGCSFIDIGADGIQWSELTAATVTRATVIEDCLFEVRRPYVYYDENGDASGTTFGNVGENGLDFKTTPTNIRPWVRNCTFRGFRPSLATSQDATGSQGTAVIVHRNATQFGFDRCVFENNTHHITPSNDRDLILTNCIFKDVTDQETVTPRGEIPSHMRFNDFTGTCLVEGCTFYQNEQDAAWSLVQFNDNANSGITYRNNIFNGAKCSFVGQAPTTTFEYNAWGANSTHPAALDGTGDVNNADLEVGWVDFYPTSGTSPVVGAGTSITFAYDYYNNVRDASYDIGAVVYIDTGSANGSNFASGTVTEADGQLISEATSFANYCYTTTVMDTLAASQNTIVLDANNHTDSYGAYYIEVNAADNSNVLSTFLSTVSSNFQLSDGTTTSTLGWTAAWHQVGIIYSTDESLMALNVDGTWAADVAYDGTLLSGNLDLFRGTSALCLVRNLRRYNLPYSAARSKINELMA